MNNRREFLKALSASTTAAMMARAPRLGAEVIHQPAAKADSCILLWMAGGMAAPETFDPKRYQPFEKGVPISKILSTFPSIRTAVDNISICKGLENIASVMDRATLIRSAVQEDLGSILHSRHQYHWHTGYVPPQTVAAPHMLAFDLAHAVVAQVLAAKRSKRGVHLCAGPAKRKGVGHHVGNQPPGVAGFEGLDVGHQQTHARMGRHHRPQATQAVAGHQAAARAALTLDAAPG
jgi:hypothetical protein